MSALLSLAARVEALSGPDLIVDELILLATGWTLERAKGLGERATLVDPDGKRTAHRQGDGWFNPTASLDAAMMLVPEGLSWLIGSGDDLGPPHAWVGDQSDQPKGIGAATPALALCAAALRAKAGQP